MPETMLGGVLVAIGGESLGVMVRWRRLVADAVRPVIEATKDPAAEGFAEFMRGAAGALTLEAKLALVYAWQPSLEEHESQLLELATDEELEGVFDALLQHAYPLARAARPTGRMNGATPPQTTPTLKSYG
jgi:hypothetical protein